MADLDDALTLLDLDRAADSAAVRRRYRQLVKSAHPDRGGDPGAVRQVVSAYRTVMEAFGGRQTLPEAEPPTATATPPRVAVVPVDDDAGVVLDIPADRLFFRLHDALDEVGSVTYADQHGGLLEALVTAEGFSPCQLVARLLPETDETRVLFTLESLDNGPALPIEDIVARLAARAARPTPGG